LAGAGSWLPSQAIIFGGDDYAAAIGATRTPDSTELFMARQQVVMYAKSVGLQAIDIVNIDFTNLQAMERESAQGAGWGFTGKQVIHPKQVAVANQAFSPSEADVAWASRIVEEFAKHEQAGTGAFQIDGTMIDAPTVKQAVDVLQRAGLLDLNAIEEALG
jgi:citrate lyase subunit beta-like protein